MPDRYWVGGSGSWNGTAGTKWAATSGGAGGASVPTTADDVFFDAASGTSTVTIDAGNLGARSINCTGFTGTLGGAASLTVAGGFTFVTAMGFTYGGSFTIAGPGTLTSAGKSFAGGGMLINAPAGIVNLGDALNLAFNFSMQAGTFNTNNFNLTCQSIGTFITGTRAMNLGSSTVTLSGNFFPGDITLNAGTSQINLTGASPTFASNGGTLHNVAFTNTTAGTVTINDNNTFNALSFTAPLSAGVKQVAIAAGTIQTVNGTFSTPGSAGNQRVWFRSATYGISTRLVINSAPSLTDADFRDVLVSGTSAPISGTRIGDLRGNSGVTFSTPKTVYWNSVAGGNWSDNAWASSIGGVVNTDNFPLAQDTAAIVNSGLNSGSTVTMNSLINYCGTVDLSARSISMTFSTASGFTVYGDFRLSSSVTMDASWAGRVYTFSGRNGQIIQSAGKQVFILTVDSYGGTVTLADALNIGTQTLTVTNGTFDTGGFAITAGTLNSSNSNVREIFLRTSTLTMAGDPAIDLTTSTNLTFDAGESSINCTNTAAVNFNGGGQTFHNVSFTATGSVTTRTISGTNVFNNLTFSVSINTNIQEAVFSADQTIIGTLNVQGGSVIRRTFVRSNTVGVARTLTVGTLLGNDSDFRDITIAGAAAGTAPLRSGDAGGNSGIVFPAPKTVYWNLSGSRDWSSTAWATSSGGTPSLNNFPLAQDTAVFDNTGAAGTILYDEPWLVRNIDGSARTAAVTFSFAFVANILGNVTLGTGFSSFAIESYGRNTTQTITTNGVSLSRLTIDAIGSTVVLADALTATSTTNGIELIRGTFDAASYNVTTTLFNSSNSNTRSLIMGSGTWTLTHTGTVWNLNTTTNLNFNKGTANIVLSNNTTTARTFAGGGLAYNRLTIGGATSTSTTTIDGNNIFTELASTKTVAHTIALGTTAQTFGAWTVTGTVGNVVTLTGTGVFHTISGAATSGIDYLAMGSIGFASSSPGEFYAGANSTGTAGAPVFRTAPPTPRTLYWVGGTGNWGDTARWSTASGGAGGAAVPTSRDNVIFNSASNATAYTVTLNVQARCNELTISGPASGNMTLAGGTFNLNIHGNAVFPATGFTRTFTTSIVLSGSTTGKTFTSNGVVFTGIVVSVDGIGCGWTLGSALDLGNFGRLGLSNGTFSTGNFNMNIASFNLDSGSSKTLNLGSSTILLTDSSQPLNFGTTETIRNLITLNAGTSQINIATSTATTLNLNGLTYNNITFVASPLNTPSVTINGSNSFNNLTFSGWSSAGLRTITLAANQTVTGTLTFSAPTDATRRNFIRSNTLGTTRTITAGAFSGTDVDFRDITIAGAAAPASGTRLGNCGGNSGITFPAGVNKFWNLAAGGNWSATAWATTGGGTPDANNFPLAQDTCVFQATGLNSGATVTINAPFNIGTIDISARTTNTMTLATGSQSPVIHGNWINGTGTFNSGTGTITYAGRTTQTITSAGVMMGSQTLRVESPGGSVTLLDALSLPTNTTLQLAQGTFNSNSFNVSVSAFALSGTLAKTLTMGSSNWSMLNQAGSAATMWDFTNTTGLTFSGSGQIRSSGTQARTFAGGNFNYSGITLVQFGGTATLTITGNNTFRGIDSLQPGDGATTISLGTTTQTVTEFFRARGGGAGNLLVQGSSTSNPATLVYTGTGQVTNTSVNQLTLLGVRAYPLRNTWYAGNSSTNSGTLGWIFEQTPATLAGNGNFFMMFY